MGGLSYGIASLLTDASHAQRWGLGVGGFAAFTGLGLKMGSLSAEEAEMFYRYGRRRESRLKLLESIIEEAAGVGVGGGIAGFEVNGLSGALIGAALGASFGAFDAYRSFKERIEPFPELEFPVGNRTMRDTAFPDRYDGRIMPLVYRASLLQDFIEFRAANKEQLVKKAGEASGLSATPNKDSRQLKYLTAIAIIPNVRHDPEDKSETETNDIELSDDSANITVHPLKDSSWNFWPKPTIFDFVLGLSRYFNEEKWNEQRSTSWENMILLLCQYQISGSTNQRILQPNPHEAVDNYWLLDINISRGGGGGRRIRKRKRVLSVPRLPWSQPEAAPQGI